MSSFWLFRVIQPVSYTYMFSYPNFGLLATSQSFCFSFTCHRPLLYLEFPWIVCVFLSLATWEQKNTTICKHERHILSIFVLLYSFFSHHDVPCVLVLPQEYFINSALLITQIQVNFTKRKWEQGRQFKPLLQENWLSAWSDQLETQF